MVWLAENNGKEIRHHSGTEAGFRRRFCVWPKGLLPGGLFEIVKRRLFFS